jgi:hypothetical protein
MPLLSRISTAKTMGRICAKVVSARHSGLRGPDPTV